MRSILLRGLPPTDEMNALAEDMRVAAALYPCETASDGYNRDLYRFLAGRYSVCLALEHFQTRVPDTNQKLPPPPLWHLSVTILHEITHGTDQTFGLGQQAILTPDHWNPDDYKDSREIMGYLIPIIEHDQPVIERKGLWAYHWYTPAESRYAKESYGRAEAS